MILIHSFIMKILLLCKKYKRKLIVGSCIEIMHLTGLFGLSHNLPQLASINRGDYRIFEKDIRAYIQKMEKSVDLEWQFIYGNGGTRPTQIIYDVFDDEKKVLSEIFEN